MLNSFKLFVISLELSWGEHSQIPGLRVTSMGAILFQAEAFKLLSTRFNTGVKRDPVVPETNLSADTHSKLY